MAERKVTLPELAVLAGQGGSLCHRPDPHFQAEGKQWRAELVGTMGPTSPQELEIWEVIRCLFPDQHYQGWTQAKGRAGLWSFLSFHEAWQQDRSRI